VVDAVGQRYSAALVATEVVVGVLGCLGLWVRRRWPVGFAVVMGVFSVFSVAGAGLALIALFTVAVHRRFAVVAPIVAGHSLAAFVSSWVGPDQGPMHWSQVVLGVVFVTAMLAWGMYVRARRQSVRDEARRVESEKELLVAQVRQHERDRIAREMHDVLAHRVSLVSLHAGALELRLRDPEDARAAGVIRDCAHQALEDLRDVLGVLRADPGDDAPKRPQPTLADLPALVDESRRAGMRVRYEEEVGDLDAVPAVIGRSVYRVAQEGLTNARKHAYGSTVSVTVRGAEGDGLTVEIRNPAGAGARIPGAGTGLIGLAERAGLAGGRLEHGRTESGDFRLWMWLPWR
jgi:signal transduction histidine kinase